MSCLQTDSFLMTTLAISWERIGNLGSLGSLWEVFLLVTKYVSRTWRSIWWEVYENSNIIYFEHFLYVLRGKLMVCWWATLMRVQPLWRTASSWTLLSPQPFLSSHGEKKLIFYSKQSLWEMFWSKETTELILLTFGSCFNMFLLKFDSYSGSCFFLNINIIRKI